MQTSRGFDIFQRWRRPTEVGFWIALLTVNVIFNSIDTRIDHAGRIAPWALDASSTHKLADNRI